MVGTRRSGARPKPTAMKLLAGNPGKRPISKNEPKPMRVISTPPHWLSVEATAYWDKIEPMLFRIGVLTEADELMLAILCQAYANLLAARAHIDRHGAIMKTPNGHLQISPFKTLERQAYLDIIRCCQEFGLSPASRSRIVAQLPNPDSFDPFNDL